MSGVSWIKIRTDMFADEKIRLIEQLPESDSILVIWVKLLALAGQKNAGGEIFVNDEMPYTDELLAAIFHRKPNTVRLALTTFQKFRMIEISEDQTIVICNWAKHQSVDKLEKIKQLAIERQKRWRQNHPGRSKALVDVTHNVTEREGVTQKSVTAPTQSKSKIESKSKKTETKSPPTVPQGGQGVELSFDEAKAFLSDLFGREKRKWSDEEDCLLRGIVPIPRHHAQMIATWFKLSNEHPIFDPKHTPNTKRKQELTTFLRDYNGELDKMIRFAPLFVNAAQDGERKKEPPRWREFFTWKYPSCHLPRSFHKLEYDQQREYERDYETFLEAQSRELVAPAPASV